MGKTIAANDQALASDILSIIGYGLAANIPAAAAVLVDSFYWESDTKILKQEQAGVWAEIARGESAIRLAQLAERAFTSMTGRITTAQQPALTDEKMWKGTGANPEELTIAASRVVGRKAAGDVVALTGAEVLTIIGRIGKGNLQWTAAKLLLGAGAGADPTEVDLPVAGATVASGTYSGNDTDNRQITTGFKCSFVICVARTQSAGRFAFQNRGANITNGAVITDFLLHATDGFVVDELDFNKTAWGVYDYFAISE